VVLTIKLRETVCEFELTLKHNEDRIKMKDLLYELDGKLGPVIGSYIFMAQKIAYPLLAICRDISSEFGDSEKEEEKRYAESAKFIMGALEKNKASG
jgi:hypothetical protein